MSEKASGSKRFGRSSNSTDSELVDTRAQLSASEETRRKLEALVKQKVDETTELQRKLQEADQRILETQISTKNTNSELEKQLEELQSSKTNADRLVFEKESKIGLLETQLKTALDRCGKIEAEEASIKKELQKERAKTESILVEFRSKETENHQLRVQLKAAMKDLAVERENHSEAEESRRTTGVRIEELLATLEEIQITNEEEKQREREKNDDLWKQNASYFYTAAISACATAAVVSIFFRHYKKS
eukprot:g3248.t1